MKKPTIDLAPIRLGIFSREKRYSDSEVGQR